MFLSYLSIAKRLVGDAGNKMVEIVESEQRVITVIERISVASSRQRKSIEEISRAVSQVDQMTQQNAVLVEESAAAAESLKERATRLMPRTMHFSSKTQLPVWIGSLGARSGSPRLQYVEKDFRTHKRDELLCVAH